MTVTYPALFHYGETACWAEFPDIPGCFTQGDTPEEAQEMAVDALGLHIEGMLPHNMPLNPPSDPDDLHADDGFVALVTAEVEPESETEAV